MIQSLKQIKNLLCSVAPSEHMKMNISEHPDWCTPKSNKFFREHPKYKEIPNIDDIKPIADPYGVQKERISSTYVSKWMNTKNNVQMSFEFLDVENNEHTDIKTIDRYISEYNPHYEQRLPYIISDQSFGGIGKGVSNITSIPCVVTTKHPDVEFEKHLYSAYTFYTSVMREEERNIPLRKDNDKSDHEKSILKQSNIDLKCDNIGGVKDLTFAHHAIYVGYLTDLRNIIQTLHKFHKKIIYDSKAYVLSARQICNSFMGYDGVRTQPIIRLYLNLIPHTTPYSYMRKTLSELYSICKEIYEFIGLRIALTIFPIYSIDDYTQVICPMAEEYATDKYKLIDEVLIGRNYFFTDYISAYIDRDLMQDPLSLLKDIYDYRKPTHPKIVMSSPYKLEDKRNVYLLAYGADKIFASSDFCDENLSLSDLMEESIRKIVSDIRENLHQTMILVGAETFDEFKPKILPTVSTVDKQESNKSGVVRFYKSRL